MHFISDHARCFTGQVFRRKLLRLGVKQRFGAVGKKGSIALIERMWRTLKDTMGLRLLRPLAAENLMEKVEIGLLHYAHFRPHQGLGGATPAEIYFGREPSHLSAIVGAQWELPGAVARRHQRHLACSARTAV